MFDSFHYLCYNRWGLEAKYARKRQDEDGISGRPAMYIKEYKYGENQVVTPIDKDTTILECDMLYKYNTIKFVLGFGVNCEVLEPVWLKDEIKRIGKAMAER